MEARLREVQPVAVDTWIRQDHGAMNTPLVQPPVKAEGNQAAKSFGQGRKAQEGSTTQGDPGKTQKLVEEVQSYLDNINIQLSFDIHDETGEMVVQVLERETGDLIRQIPPEDLLDLKDKLSELRGVLFHQKV
jgi:flagellar protein FlaG